MLLLFCKKTPSTWQLALIERMQHNTTPLTWHLALIKRTQPGQGVQPLVQNEVRNEV